MTGRSCVSVLVVSLCIAATPRPGHAETISLTEALRRADSHYDVQLARASVAVARGRAQQARTTPFNPELSAGLGPRFGGGSTMLDFEIGLGQALELGGKRRHRAAAADERVTAARATVMVSRQLAALRVRRAYALALVSRARVDAYRDGQKIAEKLSRTATLRLAQGVGTQLEVNMAAATLGHATREFAAATQQFNQATVDLAAAVGAQPNTRIEPQPTPLPTASLSSSAETLVVRALSKRAELKLLSALTDVAAAETRLADALAVPDLGVGVSYAREEGSQQVLLSLSIGVPMWNRNRGSRSAARAVHRRAKIRSRYRRREVAREVHAAYARHKTAQASIAAFRMQTVGTLRNNLLLTQDAFLKGKISIIDYNLLRRQFVDTRLAYLGAVAEGVLARHQLERAVGGGL